MAFMPLDMVFSVPKTFSTFSVQISIFNVSSKNQCKAHPTRASLFWVVTLHSQNPPGIALPACLISSGDDLLA